MNSMKSLKNLKALKDLKPCMPLKSAARLRALCGALGAASLLSGCMNLTGLDASSTFSCPRVDGVPCSSLPETYEASLEGTLPHQRRDAEREREKIEKAALTAKAAQAEKAARKAAEEARRRTGSEDGIEGERIAGTANARSEATPSAASSASAEALDAPESAPSASAAGAASSAAPAAARRSDWPAGLAATASPGRIPEKLLRLWIAPWTDEAGDLHDASYVFVRVAHARWATAKRREPLGDAVVALPFDRAPRSGQGRKAEASSAAPALLRAGRPFGDGAAGMAADRAAFAEGLERLEHDAKSAVSAVNAAAGEVRRHD